MCLNTSADMPTFQNLLDSSLSINPRCFPCKIDVAAFYVLLQAFQSSVSIPLLEEPEPLKQLLSYETEESCQFLNRIRKCNSCFHMTSLGADNVVAIPGFSPTFTIQGQVYYKIGSMLPVQNMQQQFLQIYFMGDEEGERGREREIDR
ncbi:hypothetical protein PR048_031795 [Dryococelus australis]|uniref:Uncharacterized protein n=1 Tax=Dryococelus australis TaxID=614101 RepID=A0ABQ9G8X7_9NEOP|nr:hypothetical protein PR048_031795 [Dryococelus australis]